MLLAAANDNSHDPAEYLRGLENLLDGRIEMWSDLRKDVQSLREKLSE